MKTPNPTFKDSESNRQADGVSPHPSVRGAVEPRFATVAAGKFTPLLALVLALTLPSLAQAQFEYMLENGAVTITGYTGPGGELTIPDAIDGLPVTGIGWGAFYASSHLTSVIIPNTVTSIGDYAFGRCAELNNLNLPRDLIAIGVYAFRDCTRLTTLMIPDGVVVIGQSAFRGCTSLISITIPASVTSLGEGVFARCTGLTAIDVDASNPAYSSLDGVLFNKDQTMLIYCSTGKAGNYTIPNNVTSIAAEAFYGCRNLNSVIIGDSVTSIPVRAFHGCTSLTNLVIPNGVISLGDRAFSSCPSLASITIPASVISIGEWAFSDCTTLNHLAIPDNVVSIGSGVFSGCAELISVTIGNGVTHVPENAFRDCTSLADVTIPNTVTNIGGSAFIGCTSLVNLVIPDSVTTLGYTAFTRCASLPGITIPASVTSIASSAFWVCDGMTTITVDAGNMFYSSLDGALFNKSQTTLIQCPGGKTGNFTIPASVTSIEPLALLDCASLTSITVDSANPLFSSLDGVLFDKNQTALLRCPEGRIGSYMIPGSVTHLGDQAFSDCADLTEVTLPASVISIGSSGFRGCAGLTTIMVDGGNMFYSSLDGVLFDKSQTVLIQCPGGKAGNFTIPASVTNIDYRAFRNGASLTSITVDAGNALFSSLDGVLFDKSQTALLRCPEGRTGRFTIPSSVTHIGELAFDGCADLTEVTIPASVTAIGMQAFIGCTGLTSIYFLGDAPVSQRPFYTGVVPTIYYLPGTTGWREHFDVLTTVVWDPRIETSDGSFGVQSNQFGFNIAASSELTIVVEASATLINPDWTPVGTNTLAGGTPYFSDPQWTSHPARFYRLRSP